MYGDKVFSVTFMKTGDFHVIMIGSLDEMKEAIMVLFPSHSLFFGFDFLIKSHVQKYLLFAFAFHQCNLIEIITRDFKL